jgi:hypothetical protein
MDNSNKPDIRAYIGATGSGKGVSVRAHLKDVRPTRFLVWDPLGEYSAFVRLTTGDLAAVAKAAKGGAFAVAYYPGPDVSTYADKFALFCRIAFAAGNCVVLVEELADLTSPSFAPMPWRRLTTQGRHRGIRIVTCSQRPAQVDKQFLGNCTYIRCFTLRYPQDRQAMAGAMSVPLVQIEELQTVETDKATEINYLERDFRTQKTNRGTVRLTRK